MKVVILAGGYGSRLSEYTESIPKPMVTIGGIPILIHIMNHYSKYGFREFIIALGYKSDYVKNFFLNYNKINNDFTLDFVKDEIILHNKIKNDWKVTLVNTGLNSMTGGRLKRIKKFIGNKSFFMTYGDGVSNVNIKSLLNFHKKNKKIVTVTAVRPIARFGELNIEKTIVKEFNEKPLSNNGWINGGYFVMEPSIFDYIKNDQVVLEKGPLTKIAKNKQLVAYKHNDFWQCMDTKRDRDYLEILWMKKNKLW